MMHRKKTGFADTRYDERQIIERGNAFRNGYLSLLAAVAICYFLRDIFGWEPVDGGSAMLLCIWISAVVISVTMIVKNAYDGIQEGWNSVAVWVMGATGMFCLVGVIVRGILGTFNWYDGGGAVFTSIGMLVIFIVYRVKQRRDKQAERADD
jgi:hypothetical protein